MRAGVFSMSMQNDALATMRELVRVDRSRREPFESDTTDFPNVATRTSEARNAARNQTIAANCGRAMRPS
jgi:hypothetical protein